eukprot:TRINITY_DN11525_c0_g1_i1.p2 TRINITY_DN11525_c0_g1~~TRINITY_DN11525_c0_g1_i1.p2  ORF type:complete len:156 (-),score=21.09 TRINITY_DN11525_c0_g1_i1:4-471(-)
MDRDHHCGVMGSCIAQNNIRFFNGFLLAVAMANLCATITGLTKLMRLWGETPRYTYVFFRTCFLLVGAAPGYVGTLWLFASMAAFYCSNVFNWSVKHNTSLCYEAVRMWGFPMRHRRCGPRAATEYAYTSLGHESEHSEVVPASGEFEMEHVKDT